MPDERTNSKITWYDSPLRANHKPEGLVDTLTIGHWYTYHAEVSFFPSCSSMFLKICRELKVLVDHHVVRLFPFVDWIKRWLTKSGPNPESKMPTTATPTTAIPNCQQMRNSRRNFNKFRKSFARKWRQCEAGTGRKEGKRSFTPITFSWLTVM